MSSSRLVAVVPRTTTLAGFGPSRSTRPSGAVTRSRHVVAVPTVVGLSRRTASAGNVPAMPSMVHGVRRPTIVSGADDGRLPVEQHADPDGARRGDRPERRAAVVVGEDRRRVLSGECPAARAVLGHADTVAVAAPVEGDGRAEDGRPGRRRGRRSVRHDPGRARQRRPGTGRIRAQRDPRAREAAQRGHDDRDRDEDHERRHAMGGAAGGGWAVGAVVKRSSGWRVVEDAPRPRSRP